MVEFELPDFPSRKGVKGRPGKEESALRMNFKTKLADAMNHAYKRGKIWTTRGWCYALEELAGLKKNDFDAVEKMIVDLRKEGLVPLDAVLEDQAREWDGFENVHYDVDDYVESIIRSIKYDVMFYKPYSFWSGLKQFVCVAVEKRDLISIFKPICRQYNVPLANFRGSPDMMSRGKVLREFMWHWLHNREVVILYCGDHDPAGLRMSGEEMTNNFATMHNTMIGDQKLWFQPNAFRVERFGLNADFIEKEGISWSENLITGQKDPNKPNDLNDPKHPDHNKPYVQDYIKEFGARKVEANALVVREKKGQELCRSAIERYISLDYVDQFNESLKEPRFNLAKTVSNRLLQGIDFELAA